MEHNNSITGFRLVYPIILMGYIRTNYGNVPPKQLQENEIALDAQWDPTNPITLIFTRIGYYKLFYEYGEEPFTEKISFSLHTLPLKTLDCSTCHVIPVETTPQSPNFGVTSRSSLPKRQPASNITPLAESDSMMKMPIISYN